LPQTLPEAEKAPGKKPKYTGEEKLRLALAVLEGCSLSSAGEVQLICSAPFEVLRDGQGKGASRTTAIKGLAELYQCFKFYLAEKISLSSSLSLTIVTTTDSHRELMALLFAGVQGELGWEEKASLVELRGHQAQVQVEIIRKLLQELNVYQQLLGVSQTKIYHITSLTADNTGSNTGKNGVRGLLEKERQRVWFEEGKNGECQPLVFKGCEDHIVNLASNEFEKRLVNRSESWGKGWMVKGKKHVSATALCHIMARLRSDLFYRPFKAFLKKMGGKPLKFERYSETRYASVCILSLRYLEGEKYILLFLRACRCLLTKEDLASIKLLLNHEVREVIRIRALFALNILLPIMKYSAQSNSQ